MNTIKLLMVTLITLQCRVQGDINHETDIATCCKRRPNSTEHDSKCTVTELHANKEQHVISTPGFPQSFPKDVFCKWAIHAPAGKRIRLEFRDFKLARSEVGCHLQQLLIHSPITGKYMGPFCGHDGIPNVVSTGNYLIVELKSPAPVGDELYKGFQMLYTETVQSTSPELRPLDWHNGLFLTHVTETTTMKPSRFKPSRKPLNKILYVPKQNTKKTNYVPSFYQPPPRVYNFTPLEKPEGPLLKTEAIVGIVIGGILLVAILSVTVAKMSYCMADRKRARDMLSNGAEGPLEAQVYQQSKLPNYTAFPDQSRIPQRMPQFVRPVVVVPSTNLSLEKERSIYAPRELHPSIKPGHLMAKEKSQRKNKRPKEETTVNKGSGRKSVRTYEEVGAIKEYPLYPATKKHAVKRDTETPKQRADRKTKKSYSIETGSKRRESKTTTRRKGNETLKKGTKEDNYTKRK